MRQSETSVDRRGSIFDRCDAKECRSHKQTTQTELLLIMQGLRRRLQDSNRVRDAQLLSLLPRPVLATRAYRRVCVHACSPESG